MQESSSTEEASQRHIREGNLQEGTFLEGTLLEGSLLEGTLQESTGNSGWLRHGCGLATTSAAQPQPLQLGRSLFGMATTCALKTPSRQTAKMS